mmetsp:Transcript_5318/g.6193  ORF Transcript_5318/g.6193 Transcript_5318/m.6193 type:complete len:194 (+) Transcript_5318:157-738(+)|eukprot:CAMPEP_0184016864 /NCGR_PEP_ID=MMETSP0954-20121128/7176_1 /TAXON_ID=627963 /ORGANISM="Aplanochytrium sp, Strain PBS07" /LENGTH=193 /DNA_ID=CAMNT_0026297953 /DNA_START=98 /DNA_END=682 /DNA_ORIENTATION=-
MEGKTACAATAATLAAVALAVKFSSGFPLKTLDLRSFWKSKRALDKDGDYVGVHRNILCVSSLVELVSDPGSGAISTFSGTTRDNFDGKEVVRLEYEGYIPMALKELKKICSEIRTKWDVRQIAIEHRLGLCPVMEASVIIAVSSAHRKESLKAVEFAINRLKEAVPIWKKEVYGGGDKATWKENSEFKYNRK